MPDQRHNSNEIDSAPVVLPAAGGAAIPREAADRLIQRNVLFRAPWMGTPCVILLGRHHVRNYRNALLVDALVAEGHLQFQDQHGDPAHMPGPARDELWALLQAAPLPILKDSMRADLMFCTGAGWKPMRAGVYGGGLLVSGVSFPHLPKTDRRLFQWLPKLFSGLNCTEATRQRLEILLCLMVGRAGMDEFPLVLVNAPSKNSGKTRAALAAAEVVGSTTVITDRARLNQQAGSVAWAPGPHVLLFDNVNTKLFGEVLSSGVHSRHLVIEPKYQGMSSVFSPIMLVTVNEGRVEHDLHDKALWVTLEGNPGVDAIRFDPDPLTFAREHRLSILHECRQVLAAAAIPSRDEPREFQTRFIAWELAYTAVARVLGYAVDLRPAEGEVRDQLVIDLLNAALAALEASDKRVTTSDVVRLVKASKGWYQDAYHHICSGGRPPSAQAELVRGILAPLSGKDLTVEGWRVTLKVDGHSIDKE